MTPEMKFCESTEDQPARVTGVPVFREGDYSPQGTYSAADVQEMADTYDPSFLEAPLTPDHEQTGPAWGWWERFYTVNTPTGLELFGDCKLLFYGEYMWKSGMYKRRSVEVYRDLVLPNGQEGHYVKAVSLLGAATPAVKGLQNMFKALPADAQTQGMPAFINNPQRSAVQQASFFSVNMPGELPLPPLPAFNTLPSVAAEIGKEPPNMDANDKKAGQAENFTAAEFADLKKTVQELSGLVTQFKDQAAQSQAQAEEFKAQLDEQKALRQAAEADAFSERENKRFDDALAANKDKVTPAVAKRLRVLFNACPADSDAERHVSFKDGANDKTLSMRALILECMSAGSPVINLEDNPESEGAPDTNANKVPLYGTPEFSDQVDADAKTLMTASPDKFKTYTDAADQAYRALMQRQPADSKINSKRSRIPKA